MCSNFKAALALLAMPPLSGQGKGVCPFALHLDRGVCVGGHLGSLSAPLAWRGLSFIQLLSKSFSAAHRSLDSSASED